jgi:hypothetical protein
MSEFRPLTKEILKEYANENPHVINDIRYQITYITKQIYHEIIQLAMKGDTKYAYELTIYRPSISKRTSPEYKTIYVKELISSLYLVLPDSNIQYNEKKIYDLQDRETIVPCIMIDWS